MALSELRRKQTWLSGLHGSVNDSVIGEPNTAARERQCGVKFLRSAPCAVRKLCTGRDCENSRRTRFSSLCRIDVEITDRTSLGHSFLPTS